MLIFSPPNIINLFENNKRASGSNEMNFQASSNHNVSDLNIRPKISPKNTNSDRSTFKDSVCKNLSPKRLKVASQFKSQNLSRRWSLQPQKIKSIQHMELDDRSLIKNILNALIERGQAKSLDGDCLDAATAFNDALTIQRIFFDHSDCHANTGSILNEIGIVLSQLGDDFRTLALNSFDKAIEIHQNSLGPGDKKTADSVHNLWVLLHNIRHQYMNKGAQLNCFRSL